MTSKTIYLIRHAQPDFPDGRALCLGQKLDLPLSPAGHEQAQALARYLRSFPVEAVYTSPLLRARQTAQPIAGNTRPLVVLPALIELDGGEWDGLPFEDIRRRYPRESRPLTPPGGETDESGLARALAALEEIDAAAARCAAVVAHGAINQLLLCALAGRPLDEKKRFAQDHAGISVIEKLNGVWQIKA